MARTIISARYSNPDNSAAEAFTKEVGSVSLSAADTPADWANLLSLAAAGSVVIDPYEPGAATVSTAIRALTPKQAHVGLADRNLLDAFYAWLGGLPMATQKDFEFEDVHERDGSVLTAGLCHPTVAGYGASQIDQFFRQYGQVGPPAIARDPGAVITYKTDVWRRAAVLGVAAELDAALTQAPPELRRLYDAAIYLDHSDPEWPQLVDAVNEVLDDDALTAQILAPSNG